MYPDEHFGLREMTSEVTASLLEGSNIEMKCHRCKETIRVEQFEANLES